MSNVGRIYLPFSSLVANMDLHINSILINYSGRGIIPGTITVSMNDNQIDYPVTVLTGATSLRFTIFPRDYNATLTLNGTEVVGEIQSFGITFVGTTIISLIVSTPDNSSSIEYTFDISVGSI